jgi:predicted enzyme related to lactoylglutathione lyase
MTPEEMADLVHLRRSRDLIDRDYAQPLDVPAMAGAALMSPAHFSRKFRAAYGETPYNYLMTRRMERAKAFLRRGMSVALYRGRRRDAVAVPRPRSQPHRSHSHVRQHGGDTTAAHPGYRLSATDLQDATPEVPSAPTPSRIGEASKSRAPYDWGMTVTVAAMFIPVHDPDAALGFYRDALGLEVRNDVKAGEFRWVTVGAEGQDVDIVLSQPHGGRSQAEGDALLSLVTQGSLQAAIFRSDDLDATFEKVRASGAEVLQEPTSQPWGVRDCAFRDPSGNLVRIQQQP